MCRAGNLKPQHLVPDAKWSSHVSSFLLRGYNYYNIIWRNPISLKLCNYYQLPRQIPQSSNCLQNLEFLESKLIPESWWLLKFSVTLHIALSLFCAQLYYLSVYSVDFSLYVLCFHCLISQKYLQIPTKYIYINIMKISFWVSCSSNTLHYY